jgi:uncharacterized membrane protein
MARGSLLSARNVPERDWRPFVAHAQQVVIVSRPIDEVFAFLADGTNNPQWRPEVTSIRLLSGSGVGAEYEQTMTGPGGRPIRGVYRVTRSDVPNCLDFEVTAGPARPVGTFQLRDLTPDSTEVTFALELKPRGVMVLMTPMINKQVRREVDNIRNLPQAMGS